MWLKNVEHGNGVKSQAPHEAVAENVPIAPKRTAAAQERRWNAAVFYHTTTNIRTCYIIDVMYNIINIIRYNIW